MFFDKVHSVSHLVLRNREFQEFHYKNTLVELSLKLVSALVLVHLRGIRVLHGAIQHSNIPR